MAAKKKVTVEGTTIPSGWTVQFISDEEGYNVFNEDGKVFRTQDAVSIPTVISELS